MSSLHRQLISKNILPPSARSEVSSSRGKQNRTKDFTPMPWRSYFDSMKDVKIGNDSFRVYLSGYEDGDGDDNDLKPTLVLLHGGGYSGLTWALFSKCIRSLCECRIMAIDLRGHGNSKTTDDDDLSAMTLARDVGNIITSVHGNDDTSQLIIIGHSMGGAIAVHCASSFEELIPNIVGLVVIDVVEGTALDSLNVMQSFLRGRPSQFPSLSNAIEWCFRSGQTRNIESARVSMPGMLKNITDDSPATDEVNDDHNQIEHKTDDKSITQLTNFSPLNRLLEDDESEERDDIEKSDETDNSESFEFKIPQKDHVSKGYTWRIDLSKSEPFWKEWFTDLSSMFLSCNVSGKLLLLAGIDRLDRTLTIGQMQGKFQMQVLPKCGHTVHEDVPDKVAEAIAYFMIRNKFTRAICEFERPFPSC